MSGKISSKALFLAVSGVLVVALIIAARTVLLPFILGLVVAYVFTPAVLRVEKLRVPRWAAILLVYAIALSAIGGFVGLIVPRLSAEVKTLSTEWPKLKQDLREKWLPAVDEKVAGWVGRPPSSSAEEPEEVKPPIRVQKRPDGSFDVLLSDDVQFREVDDGVWQIEGQDPERGISSASVMQQAFDKGLSYLKHNVVTILKVGQEIVTAISRGIFNLFMTLMLGGYVMLTHEKIIGFFRSLWAPHHTTGFDKFLRRLDRGLSGVVRGQLLICLVNGVLSAIGFWLFDLKYWPIMAILAGVMSLIPIFGSILSSIPAVAIGLTQGIGTAVGVLVWIVGIHQIEANFLNPKIIGDAAKIHPVLVVFALLVGEHFFQLPGALFAVPCLSIAQTIFLHFRESTMGIADPLASAIPEAPRDPPKQ
ncbi:MAG: AI-2E family transporter [Polyangiaceae bacterium]|nr:AI-2E family transporter [Polyangiaceae bacterium]